ncbi:Tim44 domain-containing protein [Photobacterium sp. R1]
MKKQITLFILSTLAVVFFTRLAIAETSQPTHYSKTEMYANKAISAYIEESTSSSISFPWYIFTSAIFFFILIKIIITVRTYKVNRFKKKANIELHSLSAIHPEFDLNSLNTFIEDRIHEIYQKWEVSDTDALSKKMTKDFFELMYKRYFRVWKIENILNIRTLEEIHLLEPYLVHIQNNKNLEHGITITFHFLSTGKNYFISTCGGGLIEGDKESQYSESFWTFILQKGKWNLAEIADSPKQIKLIHQQMDIEKIDNRLK